MDNHLTCQAGLIALARNARAILANAPAATLLVDGIGAIDVGAEQVVLHDAAGTPAFYCNAGSAVLEAARAARPAVLRVTTIALPDAPTSAVFLGRLAISSDGQVDTAGVVSLLLATVLLEWDAPGRDGLSHGGPPTGPHEVPLAIYTATAPLSPATGEALRAHTNSAHTEAGCVSRTPRETGAILSPCFAPRWTISACASISSTPTRLHDDRPTQHPGPWPHERSAQVQDGRGAP